MPDRLLVVLLGAEGGSPALQRARIRHGEDAVVRIVAPADVGALS